MLTATEIPLNVEMQLKNRGCAGVWPEQHERVQHKTHCVFSNDVGPNNDNESGRWFKGVDPEYQKGHKNTNRAIPESLGNPLGASSHLLGAQNLQRRGNKSNHPQNDAC